MADQPLIDLPQFEGEVAQPAPRPVRATPRTAPKVQPVTEALPTERRIGFLATIDGYLMIVVAVLLAIGLMMVYSTTFDWSYQEFGSESLIFMQHARNAVIGLVVMLLLTA